MLSNPKAGKIELKDVPLVAYDNNGEVVDVEIVPSTVDATLIFCPFNNNITTIKLHRFYI